MSDVVGQNDEIALGIEQLALAEEPTGIAVGHKASPGSAGAVEYQHGVAHDAVGILLRTAYRPVVQLHFREGLTALETISCATMKSASTGAGYGCATASDAESVAMKTIDKNLSIG